jgi:hypothetical protein
VHAFPVLRTGSGGACEREILRQRGAFYEEEMHHFFSCRFGLFPARNAAALRHFTLKK